MTRAKTVLEGTKKEIRIKSGKTPKAGNEISKRKSSILFRSDATVVLAREIVTIRNPKLRKRGSEKCRKEGSLPNSWR
jgi:hypothetical protein